MCNTVATTCGSKPKPKPEPRTYTHTHHHYYDNYYGGGYNTYQPTPIYVYTPYNLPSTYNFGGSIGFGNPNSSFSLLLSNLLGQLIGGSTSFGSSGSLGSSFGGSSLGNLGSLFGSYGKY